MPSSQRALVLHLEHGVLELLLVKFFFAALVHHLVLEAGFRGGHAFLLAVFLHELLAGFQIGLGLGGDAFVNLLLERVQGGFQLFLVLGRACGPCRP